MRYQAGYILIKIASFDRVPTFDKFAKLEIN